MADLVYNENPEGFARVPWAVLDCYLPAMGVYGLAVYALLVRFSDLSTRQQGTYVSQPRLAKMVGCSEKTVKKSLDDLERLELISRKPGQTAGVTTVFRVLKPKDRPQTHPFRQVVKPVDNREKAGPIPVTPEVEPPQMTTDGSVTPPQMTTPTPVNDDLHNRKNKNVNNKRDTSDLFEAQGGSAKEPTMWKSVIEEITRLWELGNPGVPCEWAPLAFKRLKTLLASRSKWTTENWLACIRHRFRSEGVNEGEPPESFIPHLAKYIKSPLNQFGKVDTEAKNNGKPSNRAAAANVIRELEELQDRARGEDCEDVGGDR